MSEDSWRACTPKKFIVLRVLLPVVLWITATSTTFLFSAPFKKPPNVLRLKFDSNRSYCTLSPSSSIAIVFNAPLFWTALNVVVVQPLNVVNKINIEQKIGWSNRMAEVWLCSDIFKHEVNLIQELPTSNSDLVYAFWPDGLSAAQPWFLNPIST